MRVVACSEVALAAGPWGARLDAKYGAAPAPADDDGGSDWEPCDAPARRARPEPEMPVLVRANGILVRERLPPRPPAPFKYRRAKTPRRGGALAHTLDALPAGVRDLWRSHGAPPGAVSPAGALHRATRGAVVLGDAADARVAAVLAVAADLDASLRGEALRAREWFEQVAVDAGRFAAWRASVHDD